MKKGLELDSHIELILILELIDKGYIQINIMWM